MELCYKIAGVNLRVEGVNEMVRQYMKDYLSEETCEHELHVRLMRTKEIEEPVGSFISDELIKWKQKEDPLDGYYIYSTVKNSDQVLAVIDSDTEWTKGEIKYFDNDGLDDSQSFKTQTELFVHILIGVLFRYNILNYEGIVVHASSLEYKGKGLVFTAPSGTGKSTHVKLWKSKYGDEVTIINDDTPPLRFENDVPFLHGAPWCGSSFVQTNKSVPLSAIFIVEQAPENSLTRCEGAEVLSRLMPRMFLPYFDERMMEKALNVIDKLIATTPVYVLKCRPDYEAVELVRECVMK